MTLSKTARLWLGLLVASQIVLLSGCGDDISLAPVSGQVTQNGKPQKGIWVRFTPQAGRASAGKTDDNGHYDLSYIHGKQGALLGKHTVTLGTGGEVTQGGALTPETELHNEQVEVKSGSNTFDFKLQ